ncbi:MAG: DUF302 domain-containing protein [Paracoccaceae bacterium]
MIRKFVAAIILSIGAGAVVAQDSTVYDYDGSFDDATFAIENEIIGAGLVIDYVAHSGEMLARTGPDLGSDVVLFESADVFLFCSAVLSRKVMESDPANIVYCPYGIYVADRAGQVTIGYRNFPPGEMQEVQALLDGIARAAADQ